MEILKDINSNETKLFDEPYLEIEGGSRLNGEVQIPGAKNAALPAIVAACLSTENVELSNVPVQLNDVKLLIKLLKDAGAKVEYNKSKEILTCNGSGWYGGRLNEKISGDIRHSLLLLGLSRKWKKEVFLPLPGGCDLGNRKHDMHINALSNLGSTLREDQGIRLIPGESPREVTISFYYPTFGGTLNALFASVTNTGCKVIINNVAKNPEVLDVIKLLINMGANIEWIAENSLRITGVSTLTGAKHFVMPDRIIGATVIAATGITNGNVLLKNFAYSLLEKELGVWKEAGLVISDTEKGLLVKMGNDSIHPTEITTKAYPGFHTDIQPLHTIFMVFARGRSKVTETILDGRFKYCAELNKMGANIQVKEGNFTCVNGAQGQYILIDGVKKLVGTVVKATDIRGGAAVAVGALAAEGKTIITNLYQLERGYGNFVEMFTALGAKISKIN